MNKSKAPQINTGLFKHIKKYLLSSHIRTVPSVLELHQIMPFGSWTFTTGRELHPAPKIIFCLYADSSTKFVSFQ